MKKRILSCLLAALLLTALLPAAALAEGGIIVNLGTVRAAEALDLQIASTETGTASLTGGSLPDRCEILTEERGGISAHYLRGTPLLAGSYEFTLTVTETIEILPPPSDDERDGEDGEGEEENPPESRFETVVVATLSCSITVLPDIPSCTVYDLSCFVGEEAKLRVEARVNDGGTLSYQWYSNSICDNANGEMLEGRTQAELELNTEFVGQSYYYCVVSNLNNGQTERTVTPAVTVSVTEPVITLVAIASLPTKLEYTEGDTLDTTGLTLSVSYSNGMIVNDDEGFSVSPTKLTTPGTQTITVTYQNNTVTFPVIVKEDKERVEAIAVSALPSKREYRQGDRLDPAGLTLEVITNKGNHSTLSSGFSCSPEILSQAGVQTVTVSYEGKTTSFTVTVKAGEKTVQKIAIITMPTKLSYEVGDSFDTSGMVLRVTTDQGDEVVRSGFSVSPSRFTKSGTQTVTIGYGGQSCTLEVSVASAGEQPAATEPPAATAEPKSETTPEPVQGGSEKPTQSPSGSYKAAGTMMLVIIFLALAALVAILAYLYVSHKKDLVALWQRLTHRDDEEEEEDEEE